MSRTDPQFNLRIPADLRDKVMRSAKQNKRSATAEIIARLEESFAYQAERWADTGTIPTDEASREIADTKYGLLNALRLLDEIERLRAENPEK